MPYTVVHHEDTGKYCVHKQNADGSDGPMLENACHDSAEEAGAQIGAIEHSEGMMKKELQKRVMKKEGDGEHPSSHYLVVEDPSKPTTWHLRVKNAAGEVDHRLMGAAWAALHGGYRGNKYEGPGKDAAIAKLTRLYKSEGMPVPGAKSFATFKQDKAGDWWFIGLYSNKFEDREQEIISEAAHKEYVAWANEKGFQPPVTAYHLPRQKPGFWKKVMTAYESDKISTDAMNGLMESAYRKYALARTQHLFYSNGFVGVVAKVYQEKIEAAKRLSESDYDLGMSHGFTNVQISDNIFDRYRSFEFSLLLRDRAANLFTFGRIMEGQTVFSDQDKKVLNDIEPGLADELDEVTSKMSQTLEEGGVAFKQEGEEEEAPAPDEETTPEEESGKGYTALVSKLVADLGLNDLQKVLQTNFETIDKRFGALEQLVEKVQKTEDEQIAAQYYRPDWSKISRPTASKDNIVPETQPEAKKDTGVPGWSELALKEASGLAWNVQIQQAAPVKQE